MNDDALIGHTIEGRFRLERLLGVGGMGRVFAATQLSVGREVAVKLLRSDLSGLPTLRQRFLREAQLIASIRHPNVVGLVDFGQDAETGSLYIAMEYVEGRSLTDVLRRGRLPIALALSICRQLCSGLAEAHAAGIVHRDLKPDNVMLQLTAEGRLCARLLDFGIALPRGDDETRFTQDGAVLGTPQYMSPEQAQDQPVTERSDLYSLGVIFYEMLTGAVPFRADTPLAVLFKTVNERHTPITQLIEANNELAPGELAALLDDLLAKTPESRPPNAAELGRRLDRLLSGIAPTGPFSHLDDLDEMLAPATMRSELSGLDAGSTARDDELPAVSKPTPGASLAPVLAIAVFLVAAVVLGAVVVGALAWRSLTGPPEIADRVIVREVPPTPATLVPDPPKRVSVDEPREPPAEPDPPAEVSEPKPPRKSKKRPKRPKKPKKNRKKNPRMVDRQHVACQGQDCAYELTQPGAHAACQAEASCAVECLGGGCQQICQSESTCKFDCAGGGCAQRCFAGTTCLLSCAGGGCDVTTFPGADVTHAN